MKFVKIWLKELSDPIIYTDVDSTYQKGDFFCLHRANKVCSKYPMANIWRVVEDHSDNLPEGKIER